TARLIRLTMQVAIDSFFFFQAEDGIRDDLVTGVQTCALPILFLPMIVTTRNSTSAMRIGRNRSCASRPTMPAFTGSAAARAPTRSEERRVGKECRARGWRGHVKRIVMRFWSGRTE